MSRGKDWVEFVNALMTEGECAAIRRSIQRDRPFGTKEWEVLTAGRLGLGSSLNPRGRPRREGGRNKPVGAKTPMPPTLP